MAGGDPALAARAAVSMTALQLGIGTLNDVVDAPADSGRKPGKPIPAGLVPAPPARSVAVVFFGLGILLAASVSVAMAVLGCIVVGVGVAYDLRLKGTAWSWLPFAVGIPLLPLFGWLAAGGLVPGFFAILLPTAVVAGAALAIGNALVDVDRDRAAGQTSVAVALGEGRAWRAVALLTGLVLVIAAGSSVATAGTAPAAAVGLLGAPAVIAAVLGRRPDPQRRERAWRVEVVSIGAAGVAWLFALAS